MSIWKWIAHLPQVRDEAMITLGEGNTPLVRSKRIGPSVGLRELYFKLETGNPTGSYKDRFAAVAVSQMLADGKKRCLATSSGNSGAALAAYCAAAGLECRIAIVETAPAGKLLQMQAYGAKLYRVRGFGLDPAITGDVFGVLDKAGSGDNAALQITAYRFSPIGMAGVQTIGYELIEQSSRPIDHVFSPAGGGGLTLAVARGFEVIAKERGLTRSPAVECVQPEGNDTIATRLRTGAGRARTVSCTSTISGLQVPNVLDGNETLLACRASGGSGHVVADREVLAAQARLAQEEGIFCEPAGATALAGALRAVAEGRIATDANVVCLVTGSGFKDLRSVERMVEAEQCPTIDARDLEERLS